VKIEPGYYIKLSDAIDILSIYSEVSPDGFIPQQTVQMLPRVWASADGDMITVIKKKVDPSSTYNLLNCRQCVHNRIEYSMRNEPFNVCTCEGELPVENFRCTKYEAVEDSCNDK